MRRSIAALALGGLLLLLACGGDGPGAAPGVGGDGGGGSGGSGGAGGTGGTGGGSGGTGGTGGAGGSGGAGGGGGTGGQGGTGGVTAETGAIEGLVYVDGDGDPAGALVRYTGPGGSAGETTAGPEGAFRFADLAPGEYRLEASLPAYWPGTATVQVARSRTSRASLGVGRRYLLDAAAELRTAPLLWSPAGDRVVFQLDSENARLIAWDDAVGVGSPLPTSGPVHAWGGTFSPDGRFAAVYWGEDSLHLQGLLVDFATRAFVPLGEVHAFRFAPDSRWLASWNEDGGPVRVRNLADGRSMSACPEPVHLLFSPVGPFFCRDRVAGWLRWDPAGESVEVIGATLGPPLATSANFDRGLFPGTPADGNITHQSLQLWRRGEPLQPVAASMASYRLVDDIALWIDQGSTGDAGQLVRVDLATARVEVLGEGLDAFLPSAGGQQLFALGDLPGWEPGEVGGLEGKSAPLASWNVATGTWTAVAEASLFVHAGEPAVVSAWPAFGLFLSPGPGGATVLHLHRFAEGTTVPVAADASFAAIRPQAVAYFHDEDGATRSLSVVFADGTAPVEVIAGEDLVTRDIGGCPGPRFSASLERALLTADCHGEEGQLFLWDRTLGLRPLGLGKWLGTGEWGWSGPDPEADRIPYRRVDAPGDPWGELHVFDAVAFVDRTVADVVLDGARASAEVVAFPVPAAGGTRDAYVHDLATGLTVPVATGLAAFGLDVNLGVPGAVAVLVPDPESPFGHEVRIRPPGAAEAFPVFRGVWVFPTEVLPGSGPARFWYQLDEEVAGRGRLVLVRLPGFEVTPIAEGVGRPLLVDPGSRRIAYYQGSTSDGGSSLHVTGPEEPASLHVGDRVPAAILTAGAVIYQVDEDAGPRVYALRLP